MSYVSGLTRKPFSLGGRNFKELRKVAAQPVAPVAPAAGPVSGAPTGSTSGVSSGSTNQKGAIAGRAVYAKRVRRTLAAGRQ